MVTMAARDNSKYQKGDLSRDEVFEVILDYARSHRGNSPSIRNLHKELVKRGYDVSVTSVQTHVERLQWRDKKLFRDKDGELIVIDSLWKPPGEEV